MDIAIFDFDELLLLQHGNPAQAAAQLLLELQKCPREITKEVHFSKRAYHFQEEEVMTRDYFITNHDQGAHKRCALVFEDLANLRLIGNGMELIAHGRMLPLAMVHCENVYAENFAVDYEFPTTHQLEVIRSDANKREMFCQVCGPTECEIEDGKVVFKHDSRRYEPEWVMPFEADRHMVYLQADVLLYAPETPGVHREKNGLLHITNCNVTFAPGQRLVLRNNSRPTPGIFQYLCRNVAMRDIRIYFSDGVGFLAQQCENIAMHHCAVQCRPDQPWRYFSSQADATHFCGCKGKIEVTESLFEQMGDDAINVHGVYLHLDRIVDRHTLIASFRHEQAWGYRWAEAFDKIRFIAAKTMEYRPEEFTITQVNPEGTPTESGARAFRISVREPLPEFDEACAWGVENLTWMPEVLFSKNIVRNNRARGALFSSARKTKVVGNTFDHVHGAAILLCGDCNGWFESGACGDVEIRDNHFINALTAPYQFTEAVIAVAPEIPDLQAQRSAFHGKITITGNRFETFDEPLLFVKSAAEVVFRRNTLIRNCDYAPWHPNQQQFTLTHVNKVLIENE